MSQKERERDIRALLMYAWASVAPDRLAHRRALIGDELASACRAGMVKIAFALSMEASALAMRAHESSWYLFLVLPTHRRARWRSMAAFAGCKGFPGATIV